MLRYLKSYIKRKQVKNNKPNLTNLTLSKNEPYPDRLLQTATANTSIRVLRIKSRFLSFTQALWDALTQTLDRNQSIQTLDCRSTDLGDEGIQKLAPHLKNNQNLIELNLQKNSITTNGAEAITEILSGVNQLKKLVLSSNLLADGFNKVFQTVQTNTRLTSLIINDKWEFNGINDTHADALAEMVKFNETLKQFEISGNQLSDQGVQKLCQGLLMNKALLSLNLDSATIGDLGWLAISNCISKTTSLQSLSIGNEIAQQDSITETGLINFLTALKSNTNLKQLSISFKKNSDTLAIKIAEVLETNHTLERITFKNCPRAMKQQGAEALVKVLRTHTSVYEINEGEIVKVKSDKSQIKPETVRELQQLLTRNQLIKAIKENPSALPQLIKNASATLLDNVFFATVIKLLPETWLIEHEPLLCNLMDKKYNQYSTIKKWFGIHRRFSAIENIISLLAHQSQIGDANSQMALGYIYKNQLFRQPLDPTQAKACFVLATGAKDKRIAAMHILR